MADLEMSCVATGCIKQTMPRAGPLLQAISLSCTGGLLVWGPIQKFQRRIIGTILCTYGQFIPIWKCVKRPFQQLDQTHQKLSGSRSACLISRSDILADENFGWKQHLLRDIGGMAGDCLRHQRHGALRNGLDGRSQRHVDHPIDHGGTCR